jgi:protein involved in temperature-dependent protein secretion
MEKLKLEKAVSLLDEGIRRFPNDTLIIDLYTDLLIQLGEHDKAKQVSIINMLILALAY